MREDFNKDIAIGDIVEFIGGASEWDDAECFYPALGTRGEVLAVRDGYVRVRWPKNSTEASQRNCGDKFNVELSRIAKVKK